jgi:hypothetical protein
VGDAVCLDRAQRLARVEGLHHDDRGAEALSGGAEADRRRVVQGCRRQVDRVLSEREEPAQQPGQQIRVVDGGVGERPDDALRLAGRARAVEHRVAAGLLGQRLGGMGRRGGLVGLIAVARAVDHEAYRAAGDPREHRFRYVAERRGGHQQLRTAVVDDVGRLVGAEIAIDGGEVEARADGGPVDLEVARVVLHEERHVVAAAQPDVPHQPGEPVGALVELAVADGLARARHDVGGLVGGRLGVSSGVHGRGAPGGRGRSAIGRARSADLRRRQRRSGVRRPRRHVFVGDVLVHPHGGR